MLTIKTNSKNLIEKKYIIDVLFQEFLVAEINLITDDSLGSTFIFKEETPLIEIENHYFKKEQLYTANSLPETPELLNHKYLKSSDLPVFYGKPEMVKLNNHTLIKFDVLGIMYFMLARWEEAISEKRDTHDRFPITESFAFKNNFLHRPIVNEYAYLMKKILNEYGVSLKESQEYKTFITHDIDHLNYPVKPKKFITDILKRRSFNNFITRWKYKNSSPYDNFEWLLDMSERYGHTSCFYFMAANPNPLDNDYELSHPSIESAFKLIQSRKHIAGIHPSYLTYLDKAKLKGEKLKIEEKFDLQIKEGRQHFLRFKVPETWVNWDAAGLEVDSSLGFAESPGFRCGTGNEYSVFDFKNGEKLNLKERPLIFMDTTAKYYQDQSNDEIVESIRNFKEICSLHNTPYTVLFHNSSFDDIEWNGFKDYYPRILELLS